MKRAAAFLPFLLASAVILLFSTDRFTGEAISAPLVDRLASGFPGQEPAWDYAHGGVATLKHAFAFVVLALCAFPFRASGRRALPRAFWACGAIALVSELIQAFTATRIPAVHDVALNLAATLAGLGLVFAPPAGVVHLAARWRCRLAAVRRWRVKQAVA